MEENEKALEALKNLDCAKVSCVCGRTLYHEICYMYRRCTCGRIVHVSPSGTYVGWGFYLNRMEATHILIGGKWRKNGIPIFEKKRSKL
jgi:hypothetical protein